MPESRKKVEARPPMHVHVLVIMSIFVPYLNPLLLCYQAKKMDVVEELKRLNYLDKTLLLPDN